MKGIADFFALLGRAVFKTIRGIGRFGIFSAASFVRLGGVKLRYVIEQIHFIRVFLHTHSKHYLILASSSP